MSVQRSRQVMVADIGGQVLDYVEKTSDTTITGTTEATATAIVTANAIVLDGATQIEIDFGAFDIQAPNAASMFLALYDNGASIGQLGQFGNGQTSWTTLMGPITASRKLTPSAGSHTYSIRGYASSSVTVHAGAGGSGAKVPAYIKIKRLSTVIGAAGIAGVAGGFAPLDSGLLIPTPYLPSIPSSKLPGNVWTIQKAGSSQSLTASTLATITFDAAVADGGGGVIDLAQEGFVLPASGMYLATAAWAWETTAPGDYEVHVTVGGAEKWSMLRPETITSLDSFATVHGVFPFAGTAGDLVLMRVNPGAPSGVAARGNANVNLATMFGLVRIA